MTNHYQEAKPRRNVFTSKLRGILVAMMLAALIQPSTAKVLKAAPDSWLRIDTANPAKLKKVMQMLVKSGQAVEVTRDNLHTITPRWLANFPTTWHQTQSFPWEALNRGHRRLGPLGGDNVDVAKGDKEVGKGDKGGKEAENNIAAIIGGIGIGDYKTAGVAGVAAGAYLTTPGLKVIVSSISSLLTLHPVACTAVFVVGSIYILKDQDILGYFFEKKEDIHIREAKAAEVAADAAKSEKQNEIFVKCLTDYENDLNMIKEVCMRINPYKEGKKTTRRRLPSEAIIMPGAEERTVQDQPKVVDKGFFVDYAMNKLGEHAIDKYPEVQTWVSNKFATPCNRCNPRGLKAGPELQKYLEEHPECRDCKKCKGDGIYHFTDGSLVPSFFAAPSQDTVQTYYKGCGDCEDGKIDGESCKTCGGTGECSAAKQKITESIMDATLGVLAGAPSWIYDKLAKNCPVCNKTGSKDSADPIVKACRYCKGDGLLHKHDSLSCPNCVCKSSGKPQNECSDWHLTTLGNCPTTPCSVCAVYFRKQRRLMERMVRLEDSQVKSSEVVH